MTDPLVTQYVDAALAQLRRDDLMCSPGKLPEEMQDHSMPRSNDWLGWKAVPSTVTSAELDAIERETRLKFPPLYRDFLQYRHFVELTGVGIRFEEHLSQTWRETLRNAYFRSWPRERILDAGLIPFGNEAFMDAGPVCFDTRVRRADGDCPVVFWDHEWVGTDREIQPMFSSSRKMFECLSLVASADTNFFYHDEEDDPSSLPGKQDMLTRFLALDPRGAGGPAKDYWTSWGVSPKGA